MRDTADNAPQPEDEAHPEHEAERDEEEPESARLFRHPTCKVCNSSNRREIEIALLREEPRPAIAARFPDDNMNRTNLFNHRHRHMDVVDSAVAAAVRERMARDSLDAETAKDMGLDRHALLTDMLQAGVTALASGRVRFAPSDVLAILDAREKLAGEDRQFEEVVAQSRMFVDAVKSIVPRDLWPQILDEWDTTVAKHETD